MVRLFISFVVIGLGIIALWYFSPTQWKQQGIDFISENELVPQEIREIADNIFHTPAQQRERWLAQLETSLAELKKEAAAETFNPAAIQETILKSEELLAKIKEKNSDQPSLINTAVNKLIGEEPADPNRCPNP